MKTSSSLRPTTVYSSFSYVFIFSLHHTAPFPIHYQPATIRDEHVLSNSLLCLIMHLLYLLVSLTTLVTFPSTHFKQLITVIIGALSDQHTCLVFARWWIQISLSCVYSANRYNHSPTFWKPVLDQCCISMSLRTDLAYINRK